MKAPTMVRARTRYLAIVGVATLMVLAAGPAAANASARPSKTPITNLRIALSVSPTSLTIWAGQHLGLFAKNHLSVTVTVATNINLLPPAMGSQYDLAVSTAPTLINAAQGGLPIVAAAGGTINTAAVPQSVQLMVLKSSGITAVGQLAGKTIGSPAVGGNVDDATLYWLKQAGVNLSTVHDVSVNQATEYSLLSSGAVSAVEASQPALGEMLAAGDVSLGDPWLKIPQVPNLSSLWIANKGWANTHKVVLKEFDNVLTVAGKWIAKHHAEAYALAGSETGTAAATEELSALPTFRVAIAPNQFDVWTKVMCAVSTICPTVTGKQVLANELLSLK